MLKAVVFDDEYIVLKGLSQLIDWQEYGVELAGTATDGISALHMFRELQPDIVMTDIRMPGMNGLQLIEAIHSERPNTMCIVFSGYNEFEYVKQAIKLGVVDYLEKPITITKIREGIAKAVDKIMEMNEFSLLKKKWQQGLLEQTTMNLLLGDKTAMELWKEKFGSDAARVRGVTVLVCHDEEFQPGDRETYRLVHIRNGQDYIWVLFHLDAITDEWEQTLHAWTHTAVGSGITYESAEDAPMSYKEARKALRYGKYLEGKGWIRFEDLGDGHTVIPNLSEREEEVLFDMRIGDKEGLMRKLELYLEEWKGKKLDPEAAEMGLLQILFHGLEVAKETGGNLAEIRPDGYLPHVELRSKETQEEMAGWLRSEMESIMDWIIGIRQKSKHSAVEKALVYINDHFGRDLTQQEVADFVKMNAAYFSLLFKEQMGISYIKYLTKVRMEKAKELLTSGLAIPEISQSVGYYHARHFSEVFKKQTGMTPGQYRERGGRS